jgi:hypothetical protein
MNYKFGCSVILFLTFFVRSSERAQNFISKNVLVSIQLKDPSLRHEAAAFENYEMINMQKSEIKELDSKYDIKLIDDNRDGSIDMYSVGWMKEVPHPRLLNISVKINSDVSRDFVRQFKDLYDVYKNNCTSDDYFHIHFMNKQKSSNASDIVLIFSKEQVEKVVAITPKPSPSTIAPMLINIVSGALLTALVYFWCINIE